jgi:hypothetical protein
MEIDRKDKTGKHTVMNLEYFSGAVNIMLQKKYINMNIHEKITVRTFYCGNTYPSIMIKEQIEFDNANK